MRPNPVLVTVRRRALRLFNGDGIESQCRQLAVQGLLGHLAPIELDIDRSCRRGMDFEHAGHATDLRLPASCRPGMGRRALQQQMPDLVCKLRAGGLRNLPKPAQRDRRRVVVDAQLWRFWCAGDMRVANARLAFER
jgi:hypothetical protein